MRGLHFIIGGILAVAGSTASAEEQPICADRPGKGDPTCTVPRGMVQIESGLADWITDSSSDSLTLGSTAVKYGLTDRWHIEVDIAPYNRLRARAGGGDQRDSSFGDLVLRSKYRLTAGDGVQLAMKPSVKIPIARRPIGNHELEAGIAFPIDYSIPKTPFALTLGPEIDWLADDEGRGHHAAVVQVVGFGWQANERLNLSAELWGQWNWDPAGTTRQATVDGAITYLVNKKLQLDAGANFGLNKQTPEVELYTGVSVRF